MDEKGRERRFPSFRIFNRVQWEPFEERFGAIEIGIQHHLQILQFSSQAVMLDTVKSMKREAQMEKQERERQQQRNERIKVLKWISEYDFDAEQDETYRKRCPGTGDWLCQRPDFQRWYNGAKSGLLWCYGAPGVGKSVLSSIVIEFISKEHARGKDVGLAFAFFRYQAVNKQRSSHVIATLIKQICRRRDNVAQFLLDQHQSHERDDRKPMLEDYISGFFALAQEFDQIFVIIDALDECKEESRHEILEFIADIIGNLPCAKVFVTSRRESDIAEFFDQLQAPTIQIQAKNVQKDIEVYVNKRLDDLLLPAQPGKKFKVQKLRLRDPMIRTTVFQKLVGSANGMFLWVDLQLDNIRRQKSDEDILKVLHSLPKGLDQTYIHIMEQISEQPEALRLLAWKSLVWVLNAREPISSGELIDAVAIDDSLETNEDLCKARQKYEIGDILDVCRNLLVGGFVPTPDDFYQHAVEPVHYSVREFFEGLLKEQSTRFFIQHSNTKLWNGASDGQEYAAMVCMIYLRLTYLRDGPAQSIAHLPERLSRNGFAWYCARYFDEHLIAAPEMTLTLRDCVNQNSLYGPSSPRSTLATTASA